MRIWGFYGLVVEVRDWDESANFNTTHLDEFRVNFQVEHHWVRKSISSCKWEESEWLEIDFKGLVSSANRHVVQKEVTMQKCIIDINEKSTGPRTLPCGTLERTGRISDVQPSIATRWDRPVKFATTICGMKRSVYLRVRSAPKNLTLLLDNKLIAMNQWQALRTRR